MAVRREGLVPAVEGGVELGTPTIRYTLDVWLAERHV